MPVSSDDDFELWLVAMPEALQEFTASLPDEVAAQLDYSPASLDVLEAWHLGEHPNIAAFKSDPANSVVLDGMSRYIGETFRRTVGGKWRREKADRDSVYYALPFLERPGRAGTPIAPALLVTAALDRRTGHYWRTILENAVRRASRGSV